MALDGTTALITGVDTELGAAVLEKLRSAGVKCVGHCSPGATPPDMHPDAPVVVAAPSDRAAVGRAVDAAVDRVGDLDILVTCHPRPHHQSFLDLAEGDFWSVVDDHLTGSFNFAQAAAPSLARSRGGRVVLTTSIWHTGARGLAPVAAAASGTVALVKSLTRDLGRLGIGVNAVACGFVDGEWLVCDASALGLRPRDLRRAPESFVPQGRLGTPRQVASTIAVLCNPDLQAAVGQIVNVSGGFVRSRN
jgi:NAD(P)-dependent dehydrogenase (short-subunit alcohol dehydrogenase family)